MFVRLRIHAQSNGRRRNGGARVLMSLCVCVFVCLCVRVCVYIHNDRCGLRWVTARRCRIVDEPWRWLYRRWWKFGLRVHVVVSPLSEYECYYCLYVHINIYIHLLYSCNIYLGTRSTLVYGSMIDARREKSLLILGARGHACANCCCIENYFVIFLF